MPKDKTDFDLGNYLLAQRDLLMHAFATGDDEIIQQALIRVTTVRRMKSNGTLEFQRP